MTKLVIYLKNRKNNIISAFLIAVILLGTVPITDIEILGVVPTFYRVCIPLLAVYFLYRHVTAQRSVWKNKIKLYKIFVLFVAFWIAYGIVQILVCSYVDLKLGLQELVSILLGAISALCIIECIFVYEGLTVIINSARAVVIAVTIVGIFEMATCNHFKTSMLCSDIYLNAYFDSYGFIPADGKVSAMATAIFYNVNDFMYLVDLPGYGYAKVPETEKAKWGKMIERYLHTSQTLKAVFLLIDIRHDPSANDKLMYDWIVNNGYNPIIIATKLDKLKRSQVQKNIKAIKDGLKLRPGSKIIPFSAETKQGKDEIWALMDELTGAVPAATDELKA